ncbi:hypothetical protein LAZ67_2002903 [Cordylochernes scorpioides]|uniref:ATP-dependent DNA helicase n=1 Tax=Cordylochernes scorpioides TaxID=51811 RepID=A0ABY6K5K5_9ARAC|nr:hypothetical protein LAZ67_2002903 [Cordylochernes scorpioides]
MPRKRSAIGVRTPAARRMAARAARGQSSRTLENPQQSQARHTHSTSRSVEIRKKKEEENEEVFFPRIPLIHDDKHSPLHFKRLQFPIQVSFSMSINKAQGQSLKIAGIDLEQPCFSHGQLYVDCSRVGSGRYLYALAPENKTSNFVYSSVLLWPHVVEATILTGCFQNEEVFIPRIPPIHDDKHSPLHFKRLQFPIRVSFAMSINKAQGQSLKIAGIDLEQPCFSHGQLYVACSRVASGRNKTSNFVYSSVLS